jgi:signal transduction histidine kinase
MTTKTLRLRPYARLLNMLGDQLIKNERIALIEIIKNAYDADASWVKVTFNNFNGDFEAGIGATIVIEDDGIGMSRDILENHWVNPATPTKWIRKKKKPATDKGRVIQGEKGIGRFALLKLGRDITITTRPKDADQEYTLTLDLAQYGEHLVPDDGSPLFLDELTVGLREVTPAAFIKGETISLGAREIERKPHGTRIQISHLTGAWSTAKVEKIYLDLARLQSAFDVLPEPSLHGAPDFEVAIYRGQHFEPFSTEYQNRLSDVVADHSVLRVEQGRFSPADNTFVFKLNERDVSLQLADSELTGLGVFRRYFKGGTLPRSLQCGPFGFAFYVFDFSAEAKGPYILDDQDKELIKNHRIYLYRDGIRVYPYGDPDDDWLQIDVARGTIRASEFLSNDQVVGFVQITQADNPQLSDKTSREGLIDKGEATSDFVFAIQLVLAWLRKKPYNDYRGKLQKAEDVEIFKQERVQSALERAAEMAAETDPKLAAQVTEAANLYKVERRYLVQRAETTEHLAGVGLSVETASHDLMLAMQRVLTVVDALLIETRRPGALDKAYLERELTMVRGSLSFIQSQMKDLRLLFRSTKQRRKDIHVVDILEKVHRLFKGALDKAQVEVEIIPRGAPLVAKTTDAVLLQVFLNLFDNALYWLQSVNGSRRLRIELNGDEGTLVFADNGPGIRPEDAQYLFEPFYSGKGDDGRGLGLYIARQLLERHEYSIQLADLKAHKPLKGASFVISFVRDGR